MNLITKHIIALMFAVVVSGCAVESVYPAGPGPYYDYYYYPTARVYFNIRTGFYYYFSNGRWLHSRTLPPTIRLDLRDRHSFHTKEPDPYARNKEYQSRYKPLPRYNPDRNDDHKAREYDRQSHDKYRKDRHH